MNKTFRELEKKFRIEAPSYEYLRATLTQVLAYSEVAIDRTLDCLTKDFYWKLGATQFVRLRDSWGTGSDGFSRTLKEVTTKQKDKGDNTDRLEINLNISDCNQAFQLLCALAGQPLGEIYKKELVFFTKDGAVISIAQIGQEFFVEVEGASEVHIDNYVEIIGKQMKLEREPRSLFEIFIMTEGA